MLWLSMLQVLGWEVRRPFQLMHAAVLVTGLSVLSSLPLMLQAQQALTAAHDKTAVDANYLVLLLGQKFRYERNFWLSLYTFSAWVVLHIVHKVNKEKHELRGRLFASQGRGAEAAQEVAFVGHQAEAEMCRMGKEALAAGKGPLGRGLQAGLAAQPAGVAPSGVELVGKPAVAGVGLDQPASKKGD